MEIVILKTQVDKSQLTALETQVSALQNKVIKLNVDTSGVDTKAVGALTRLKNAENALEIQRQKTQQATQERLTSENKLAIQMEKTATAEEQARKANIQLSTEIQKATTQQEMQKTVSAQTQLQQEKTATATANLAIQQERTATAGAKAATGIKQAGTAAKETGDSIGKLVGKVALWAAATTLIYGPIRAFGEALDTMKAVNTELTEVSKVTNLSQEQLKALGEQAYKTASAYGTSADAYLSSVAEFSRAGYDNLSSALAELSAKTQIAGNVSEETANKFLLTVDAAYQYQGNVEKLNAVLDGAAKIDNEYATSIGAIAEGLGKVAPIASQAHVSVGQLSAALGTITAKTQRSGTEAATALRALFLNIIGDTKTEIDEGVTWTTGEIAGLRDVIKQYSSEAYNAAEATGSVINPMEAIAGLAQSMKDGVLTEQQLMSMVSDIGGKLRTSQLLALIQNWDTYKNMLVDFGESAGTTDAMVSKSLDSWNAKTNILKNTWSEIVSKTVDTNWIKALIDDVTWLISGIDNLGTLLAILGGYILAMNLASLISVIQNISSAVTVLGGGLKALTLVLANYKTIAATAEKNTITFAAATETLGESSMTAAAGTALLKGAITAIALAITAGIMIYNNWRKSIEDAAEASLKEAQAANENSENILNLYSAYLSAAAGSDALREAAASLGEALGAQEDNVDSLISKLDKLTEAQLEAAKADANAAVVSAGKNLNVAAGSDLSIVNWQTGNADLDQQIRETFAQGGKRVYSNDTHINAMEEFEPLSNSAQDIYKFYEALQQAQQEIEVFADTTGNDGLLKGTFWNPTTYSNITDKINDLSDAATTYGNAVATYQKAEAVSQIGEDLKTTAVDSKDAFDSYIDSIQNSAEYSEDYKNILIGVANEAFPQYTDAVSDAADTTDEGTKSLSDYIDTLEKGQTALNLLKAAQEEYNDAGVISYATGQKLLAAYPDLISKLTYTANGYKVTDDALQDLIDSENIQYNTVYNNAMSAAQSVVAAENEKITALNLTTAAIWDQIAALALLYESKFIGKRVDMGDTTSEAQRSYNSSEQGQYWGEALNNALYLKNNQSVPSGKGKGGGGGSSKKTDPWEEAKNNLDDYLATEKRSIELMQNQGAATDAVVTKYKGMQGQVSALADKYRKQTGIQEDDFTRQLSLLWWEYYNDIKDINKKSREDALDAADDAIGKLDDLRDAQLKALDNQLDILEKQNKAREDAEELEEKLLAVKKAQIALDNAKKELTVRYYNAATGQWDRMADYKTAKSAEEALADAQKDLADFYSKEAYENAKAEIEAQKDNIKAAYDAFESAWDDAKTAVENGTLTLTEAFSAMANAVSSILSNYGVNLSGSLSQIGSSFGTSSASTGSTAGSIDYMSIMKGIVGEKSNYDSNGNLVAGAQERLQSLETMRNQKIISQGLNYEQTSNFGGKVYDSGGLLYGMGGIKATEKPEGIIDPELTAKMLEPTSDATFRQRIAQLGYLFGNSNSYPGIEKAVSTNSSNINNSKSYQINGVPIPSNYAETMTIAQLAQAMGVLPIFPA